MKKRIERDSLGEIEVMQDSLWGAQTQRAIENFALNSYPMPLPLIKAIGLIKESAALINGELGILDPEIAQVISKAAGEVARGELKEHFPVDVFQTGSGTSTNMNANEVIANRAAQIANVKGLTKRIHPNDHVNLCQSSNDVFPSAVHIAASMESKEKLMPALTTLETCLRQKASEFSDIIKVGRTHLQDALPMRLGSEFGAYASQILRCRSGLESALHEVRKLPLGATAIGSGLNAHKDFAKGVILRISQVCAIPFCGADDLYEAIACKGALLRLSSSLREIAVDLTKIADDLRWLSSGPRAGLAEIRLPSLAPGSSIMPGKINPVIPEMVLQICAQVLGNDHAVTLGAMGGNFELNVMMPLLARNILESIAILSGGINLFADKCIKGIEPDKRRCRELLERSLMVVTNLTRKLGYDRAAEIAKEAYDKNLSIREVVLQKNLFSKGELDELLDLEKMA